MIKGAWGELPIKKKWQVGMGMPFAFVGAVVMLFVSALLFLPVEGWRWFGGAIRAAWAFLWEGMEEEKQKKTNPAPFNTGFWTTPPTQYVVRWDNTTTATGMPATTMDRALEELRRMEIRTPYLTAPGGPAAPAIGQDDPVVGPERLLTDEDILEEARIGRDGQ